MRFFVDFTACPLHDLSESFGFFTWGLLVVGLSVAFCNLSNSCHADSPTLHWCLDLSFFFLSFFLFLSLFYLDELCFVCFVSLLALENLAYLSPPDHLLQCLGIVFVPLRKFIEVFRVMVCILKENCSPYYLVPHEQLVCCF